MAKIDEQAFSKLSSLINDEHSILIDTYCSGYEVTLFEFPMRTGKHAHYRGETLIEAIMKIDVEEFNKED